MIIYRYQQGAGSCHIDDKSELIEWPAESGKHEKFDIAKQGDDTKNAQKGIGSRPDSRSNDNDKQYTGKSSGQ